jgi:dienelactone hydrolase
MGFLSRSLACALLIGAASGAYAAEDAAQRFGARPWADGAPSLSPDGKKLVFIAPGQGKGTVAMVEDLATGDSNAVLAADGSDGNLSFCGWSADDRIVCRIFGKGLFDAKLINWARTVSADVDGKNQRMLKADNRDTIRFEVNDGQVIDWLSGSDGRVMMQRMHVPQVGTGTNIHHDENGLGVETVDTRTGRAALVERPSLLASDYMTDGSGNVRMMLRSRALGMTPTATDIYVYRRTGSRDWTDFSTVIGETSGLSRGLRPIAVDGTRDVAYAVENKDGRDALYRVSLDGKMTRELVYADPKVDVDGVVTIGRHGRVIGLTYDTDQSQVVYFDPDYRALAAGLAKGLKAPVITFISASADEKTVLVLANGDTDPGHFYLLDRTTKKLTEVLQARPNLAGITLATVKAVSYPAADGTMIPAFLTLPPGSDGKHLPTLVMPHGGPAARDEWGFDWLSQYFAHQGFAVLQPEFRGSTGYGAGFFGGNGFHDWKTAMGDVLDAGRWLDKQGIADPAKLAIFGWSYGGYAALQANTVDPDLFKAIVAVAPVTDLDMAREEGRIYSNFSINSAFLGGPEIAAAASPLRHVAAIKAPVMLFHGDQDTNVGIAESRAMDAALRRAGKSSTLIVYPGLDHQLDDGSARADMLDRSDRFLRAALDMKGG